MQQNIDHNSCEGNYVREAASTVSALRPFRSSSGRSLDVSGKICAASWHPVRSGWKLFLIFSISKSGKFGARSELLDRHVRTFFPVSNKGGKFHPTGIRSAIKQTAHVSRYLDFFFWPFVFL